MMDHAGRVEALRREAEALATAAETAGPDASVPSCPGWDVAELLAHTGRVHRWAISVLDGDRRFPSIEPPAAAERPGWLRVGAAALADRLAAVGPAAVVWSWTDDHTAGFWARRQANETAVHRVDAEAAAGSPMPVERSLAVDGIDELLGMTAFRRDLTGVPEAGTVHLHCTDGEGEWLVRFGGERPEVARVHAKGDVALRGPASDLLLVCYRRLPITSVEVFGDADLAERSVAALSW